ncbi:MAG TPA: hypothetical protein PL041_09580 [Melioribacteraceae bacterium]|nr:hypothetical protein [Melioribacteraceae bacterium]
METINNKFNENRVITLWAFSESILGGFLHLFKIPVTGLLIGGLAIIFLSLLSYSNNDKKTILKATLIVLIIKLIISPYTPINAFFSVSIQGLLCYLFSITFNNKYLRIFGFAFFSMIIFSLQKLIFIQLLFGNSLWQAIDTYTIFIAKQFGFVKQFSLSLWLIVFYISIHLLSAIVFSIISLKIISDLQRKDTKLIIIDTFQEAILFDNLKKKKKKPLKKFILIFLILILIGISYFFEPQSKLINYILIVIRFFSVFILWGFLLSPFLTKLATKFLSKKQNLYQSEVNDIIISFTAIKKLSASVWNEIKGNKGIIKYIQFIRLLILTFIKG